MQYFRTAVISWIREGIERSLEDRIRTNCPVCRMRDVASNCYMFGPTSRNRVGLITYFDELYQEVLRNIRTPFAQFVIIDQIATWTVRQGATFNEARATVTIQSIIDMASSADVYLDVFDIMSTIRTRRCDRLFTSGFGPTVTVAPILPTQVADIDATIHDTATQLTYIAANVTPAKTFNTVVPSVVPDLFHNKRK